MQLDYIRVGEGMKTRKTEQNARENYKKVYFLMIVVSTILFLTAIGCQKKVDTSLKAQSSIGSIHVFQILTVIKAFM